MNQTGLYVAASGLKWSKQAWDDLVKNTLTKLSHVFINALGFLFGVHEPLYRVIV
jgi:hypothetical protein